MDATPDELAQLRAEIDSIDDDIAESVAERVELAEEVARVKSNAGADLVDEERESTVKSRYEDRFAQEGIGGEAGRDLAAFLIDVSLDQERAVQNDD